MEINQLKPVKVNVKTLSIHVKCSDRFSYRLLDAQGDSVFKQDDGYVPSIMPGKHYGDYIILDIDIDTGIVTNWRVPSAEEIEKIVQNEEED